MWPKNIQGVGLSGFLDKEATFQLSETRQIFSSKRVSSIDIHYGGNEVEKRRDDVSKCASSYLGERSR